MEQVLSDRATSFLIILKVCGDFKEGLNFWLNGCTENQIFLRNSFFSNADIHMFFIDLINNRMFTSKWNVYHKLLISQDVAKAK